MTITKLLTMFAAAGAVLVGPLAVNAQGAPPASIDPTTVTAGDYKLESTHARVLWQVSHMAFSEWFGDFSGATGTAHFDPANAAANSVEIAIPTGSVSTTNTKLDGELKSADWFDAAAFPAITFKSKAVRFTGSGTADVVGDLTFHGVTRPATLKVKFRAVGANVMSKHYTVGFDASTSIKRSDFGVAKNVPVVGDQVDITISAPFEKSS